MLRIETTAKVIIIAPKATKLESVAKFVLAAENTLNNASSIQTAEEFGISQFGVRVHIDGREPKVTRK